MSQIASESGDKTLDLPKQKHGTRARCSICARFPKPERFCRKRRAVGRVRGWCDGDVLERHKCGAAELRKKPTFHPTCLRALRYCCSRPKPRAPGCRGTLVTQRVTSVPPAPRRDLRRYLRLCQQRALLARGKRRRRGGAALGGAVPRVAIVNPATQKKAESGGAS